jgi:serine/threonine-protein kinase
VTQGAPRPAKRDWVGKTLKGRYLVERVLGAGGMGTVYLATDRDMGRKVVVKVPHARLLDDEEFRNRFSKEIRSLTDLSQAHIVRVLDAGEAPDEFTHEPTPFAVLEYLDGGSLKDVLDRGTQALAEVLKWLPDVAKALDFVHGQGVVHRDVKPGNVLFDRAGNAVLADFGIAKTLGALDTGITRTGVTPGSPPYMGPEVGMGLPLTGAYDQYALGVLVYESLSRALPHEGTSGEVLIARKAFIEPIDIETKAPQVPEAARRAVMKAIARQPGERFPSCAEFARSLALAVAPSRAPAQAMPDIPSVTAPLRAAGSAAGASAPPQPPPAAIEPPAPTAPPSDGLIEIVEVGGDRPRAARGGGARAGTGSRPPPAGSSAPVDIVIEAEDLSDHRGVRLAGRRTPPGTRAPSTTAAEEWLPTRMGKPGNARSVAALPFLLLLTGGGYYLRWVYLLFQEAHEFADRRRGVRVPEGGPAMAVYALTPLLIAVLVGSLLLLLRGAGSISGDTAVVLGIVVLLAALPFAALGWRSTAGLVSKLRTASGVRPEAAGQSARDALWTLIPGLGLLVYCCRVQSRTNSYWTREVPR